MIVVLDTNVFISGIFFRGPPHHVLQTWKNGQIQIVLSQDILDEYQRVAESLSIKYSVDILPIIDLVTVHGHFVDTQGIEVIACADPGDNKFIECAIAGDAKIVVSGDKHLLNIKDYRGIKMVKPKQFVEHYFRYKD